LTQLESEYLFKEIRSLGYNATQLTVNKPIGDVSIVFIVILFVESRVE